MGLLEPSTLRSILEKGGNPESYPNVTDPFEGKRELDDALRSAFDVETNPTNFSNFFSSSRNINDPSRLASGQLSEFISNAEYTLFNKFKVYINGPDLSQFGFSGARIWDMLTTCAETVELPTKSLQAIPYQINSLPVLPLPVLLNYDNVLPITFRVHRDYAQRDIFLKWQELIYPTVKTLNPNLIKESTTLDPNTGLNYYDVYGKNYTISVNSLNNQGQTVMLTKFYGVYPVRVDSMVLDWSNSDYVKQSITFSFYKYHTVTAKEA